MLPAWIVICAALLRLLSGATYALAVVRDRAKPNPITWFFWALTPTIVFFAQLFEGVSWGLFTTFALGFGPFVVFILSLRRNWNRSHFTPSTIVCGIFATLGVLLWLTTNNPTLAITFSILADIFGSIPTIIKIWHNPASEYAPAYFITMISVSLTLLTITEWTFAQYAFPVYILVINIVIFGAGILAQRRLTRRPKKPRRLTAKRQ
ncbi:MAG TPA: hypothetical protein VM581_03990 [Magnetospirillaceae bacterium]|nr:hypothetical protein [Magnetospirillaceae bacterium]